MDGMSVPTIGDSSVITTRYRELIRDTATRVVERSSSGEMPFIINALQRIGESGQAATLGFAATASGTTIRFINLSVRMTQVRELFDHELWGVEEKDKDSFYALIQTTVSEVASFFRDKSPVEMTAIVKAESERQKQFAANKEKMKHASRAILVQGPSTGLSAIEGEDDITAGRSVILESIEPSQRDRFLTYCSSVYASLHETEEGMTKYKLIMTNPVTVSLLLNEDILPKQLFDLDNRVLMVLLKNPITFEYLVHVELTIQDIGNNTIVDRVCFLCNHAEKIANLGIPRQYLLARPQSQLELLLHHEEQLQAFCRKYDMTILSLLQLKREMFELVISHLDTVDRLQSLGSLFTDITRKEPSKVNLIFTKIEVAIELMTTYHFTFNDLMKFQPTTLALALQHVASFGNLTFIRDKRILFDLTESQIRILLLEPTSVSAAMIRADCERLEQILRGSSATPEAIKHSRIDE
ncbi:MAG: hypothetical protein HY860_00060 [Chlamydiales bacterium]|nr:hypothetical protein [Chlamydiales bacterium]